MPSKKEKERDESRSRSRSKSPRERTSHHRTSSKHKKSKSEKSERKRKREKDRERGKEERSKQEEEKDLKEEHDESPPERKRERKVSPEKEEGELLPDAGDNSAEQGGQEISLSIADTNALRAKLGLAPLEVEGPPGSNVRETDDPREKIVTEDGKEFVHRVPENIAEKKRTEKMREKLKTQKDKRKALEKLSGMKGLADDDDEDSAANWVSKSRQIEEEKKLAQKRAKALEEMDEEFGIGALVEEEITKKQEQRRLTAYGSKNLSGLRVEHSKEAFVEGRDTILVLKDKSVLDEDDEETLINPTLVEHEQWEKNAELRKKKPTYEPYKEDVDDFGNVNEKGLLSKYDDPEGETKSSFQIESTGTVDLTKERRLAEIKAKLKGSQQSLHAEPLKLVTEYYTPDEMVGFKKPKRPKGKKVRKRQGLKADDLVPMETAVTEDKDYGSRKRGKGRKKDNHETSKDDSEQDVKPSATAAKISPEDEDELDVDMMGPDEDLSGFVVEDDAEDELHSVLDRTRKQKLKDFIKNEDKAKKVSQLVQKSRQNDEIKTEAEDEGEGGEEEEEDEENGMIVLNSTSEYCRSVGPTRKDVVTKPPQDPDEDLWEKEEKNAKRKKERNRGKNLAEQLPDDEFELMIKEQEENKGKWVETDFESSKRKSTDKPAPPSTSRHAQSPTNQDSSDEEAEEDESNDPVLGREAVASGGVVEALKLAVQKGYLEKRKGDGNDTGALKHLEAQRYTVVDKQFNDMDDKYSKKLERMGVGGGPTRSFDEKDNYQPTIKLTYVNEEGRHMDVKEAFRYQSWKFHGKMPGKRKIEKRSKKMEGKELMLQMTSTDTPLGTLAKQQEKQKQLQTPYITLSGSGSKEMTSIKKD